MNCQHAIYKGICCSNGWSQQIECLYSQTGCQCDCENCQHYKAVNSGLGVYFKKIQQAQFGGCSGCGSDERVRY
jgi:hypothetical protein